MALKQLARIAEEFFPALLEMLLDEENKGPSDFTTRGIIMNLLFTHLSAVPSEDNAGPRALAILSYLRDPSPSEENQPLQFIANIYQSRPYRRWYREVSNVSKDIFWIFIHHSNIISLVRPEQDSANGGQAKSFRQRHFPPSRPPVPVAPYVGGVEWDATNYLASHLDLMNGLIACLPTVEHRNQVRSDLRASGFEKVMGVSLRTCKEKFYFSIHDSLRTWITAAAEDGWPYACVREGPPKTETGEESPRKPPVKVRSLSSKNEPPPKLELPIELKGKESGDLFGDWI